MTMLNARRVIFLLLGMVVLASCHGGSVDLGSGEVARESAEFPHESIHDDVDEPHEVVDAVGMCPEELMGTDSGGAYDVLTGQIEWVEYDRVEVIEDEPRPNADLGEGMSGIVHFEGDVVRSQPWPEEREDPEIDWPEEGVEGPRELSAQRQQFADLDLALGFDLFHVSTVTSEGIVGSGVVVADTPEGPRAAWTGGCAERYNEAFNAALAAMGADDVDSMVRMVEQVTVDQDPEFREAFLEQLREVSSGGDGPVDLGPVNTVIHPDAVDQGELDAEVFEQLREVWLWVSIPDQWDTPQEVSACPFLDEVGWSGCVDLAQAGPLEGRTVLDVPAYVGADIDDLAVHLAVLGDRADPDIWERMQQHEVAVRWQDAPPDGSQRDYLLQIDDDDADVSLEDVLDGATPTFVATEYEPDFSDVDGRWPPD